MAKNEVQKDREKNPEKYFVNPTGHIKDRILIMESEDVPPEGRSFALNGFAFLAKPGEVIDIPRPVRLMLDTRIQTFVSPGLQGIDKAPSKNIPRVKYQLIKEAVEVPNIKPDNPDSVDKEGKALSV